MQLHSIANILAVPPLLDPSEPAPLSRLERVSAIRDQWFDPLMSPGPILLAFAILIALFATIAITRWYRHRHLGSAPLLTFHHVAQQSGLSIKQQWTLVRIARAAHLRTPLTLLLTPDALRHYGNVWAGLIRPATGSTHAAPSAGSADTPTSSIPPTRSRRRRRLEELGTHLFGTNWHHAGESIAA